MASPIGQHSHSAHGSPFYKAQSARYIKRPSLQPPDLFIHIRLLHLPEAALESVLWPFVVASAAITAEGIKI